METAKQYLKRFGDIKIDENVEYKLNKKRQSAFEKAEIFKNVVFQRKIILPLHTFRNCLPLFRLFTQFFWLFVQYLKVV